MDATVVSTRRFLGILGGMGVRNLVHIPLGTDATMFCPVDSRAAVRRELGVEPQTPLLLYAGRMGREKNVRSLLGMMDCLGARDVRAHLVLVGDGELRKAVKRAAAASPAITWLPYSREPQRLRELYSAADLFVHAGTAETFGLVSLEAQACGTRVLAVKDGGMEETLAEERPPVLAPDHSPEALADCVRRILAAGDTHEHRRLRRDHVKRTFDSAQTCQRLLDLYVSLCDRRPPAEVLREEQADGLHCSPVLAE
jgi:alpha-1,6-mannosyltransferase